MSTTETAPESAAPVTPKLEPLKSTIGAARALIQRPDNETPWPPPPQAQSERSLVPLTGQTDFYRFINDSGEFCVKSLNEAWGKLQPYPSFCPNRCPSKTGLPDERGRLVVRFNRSNPSLDRQCANANDLNLPLKAAIWDGEKTIYFLYDSRGMSPEGVRTVLKALDVLGGDTACARNILSPCPVPDALQPRITKRMLLNAKANLFKAGLTELLGFESHVLPAYERRALMFYVNGGKHASR